VTTVRGRPGSWSATTPSKLTGAPPSENAWWRHLTELTAGSDAWSARRRDELVGSLKTKPGLRRYLRRTKSGLLRIDHSVVKDEAHLDGKWLLRTSDMTLTAEDLADAYKQLLHVERGWCDLKGDLGLRPVFHSREDRIRGRVQLCWLALLLIRVIENATGDTWRNTRHELDRMHLVTLATSDGQVAQRSATTPGQKGHPRRARTARAAPLLRLQPAQPRLTTRANPGRRADRVVTRPPPARSTFPRSHGLSGSCVPIICGSRVSGPLKSPHPELPVSRFVNSRTLSTHHELGSPYEPASPARVLR
jgi:hypothetical protein